MLELLRSDQNLLGELVSTLLLLAIAVAALAGMRRGFRRRESQDRDLFGAVPVAPSPAREPDGEALYTGTTVAGSRLERVALTELWGRWRCHWWAGEHGELLIQGSAGPVLRLGGVVEAGLVGAFAGRAVGRGRIAVVRWTLGGRQVDTGLQFSTKQEAERFVARIGQNGVAA